MDSDSYNSASNITDNVEENLKFENNEENTLHEKSVITDLKYRAFDISYNFMLYEKVSHLATFILCFAELMQLLSFLFSEVVSIINLV